MIWEHIFHLIVPAVVLLGERLSPLLPDLHPLWGWLTGIFIGIARMLIRDGLISQVAPRLGV